MNWKKEITKNSKALVVWMMISAVGTYNIKENKGGKGTRVAILHRVVRAILEQRSEGNEIIKPYE